ncbi:hypothetical protein BKA62DRAFT_692663 [Auriculariales sp. MPI-PUGE-AT-0066]|nr:hypothetical protein BKA62DRAFT_692663 [Auriculariales sp. MPI-PUGE-AT-0066]
MAFMWLVVRLAAAITVFAVAASAQSDGLFTLTSSTSLSIETFATTTSTVFVPAGSPTGSSITSLVTNAATRTVDVLVTYSVSSTPTAPPEVLLDTHIDPAFGVLGALLILSGIPTAFWGHKNRWSSFFIVGFYTLSLTTLVLILKFGVVDAVNPPSKMLRGLFVLSCAVAGFIGGGVAVLVWKLARYAVGGWGGFALALWIQCFRAGGLIGPIGFRWLFYIALLTVGFVACTIPKWHYQVMLVSTAFVGATAVMLGVDCFSSAGLKEFYVYNLGFDKLFPKFYKTEDKFQLTQIMQIELGLVAAIFLMGASVQLRVLAVLKRRLREISDEEAQREAEVEARATHQFGAVQKDMEQWEKLHGRTRSNLSAIPLLGSDGHPATPHGGTDSQLSLPTGAARSRMSGEPNLMSDTPPRSQTPGLLPALELGEGVKRSVPQDFLTADGKKPLTPEEEAEAARRDELMAEISSIRRSIDVLRSATGTPNQSMGSDGRSRVQSFGQSLIEMDMRGGAEDRQRTRSMDAYRNSALIDDPHHIRTSSTPMAPSHQLRPSMGVGGSISRPTSVPLQDDWDAYRQNRTIVVPNSNEVAPEPPRRSSLFSMPTAVVDAITRRQQRENDFIETGAVDPRSDVDMAKVYRDALAQDAYNARSPYNASTPPAARSTHKKMASLGNYLPPSFMGTTATPPPQSSQVTILPPSRQSPGPNSISASASPQVRTFEELTARHRDKLRALQNPLSAAEKEQARLNEAKERWERSKSIEKTVMQRKEQDSLAKRGKDRGGRSGHDQEYVLESSEARPARHGRSGSVDKLGADSRASRRMSTMKVEDWKQYQQTYDPSTEHSKRDLTAGDVAFPGSQTAEKRRSRTADYVLRDGRRADPPS